jgi:RNA polymerase sigma-70 factor (ECF subfamily)
MTKEAILARGEEPRLGAGIGGTAAGLDSDADLAALAGRGDSAAFRRLVDRHIGAALGIARRLLRDDAEAEDVVQDGMLRLWRSAAGLEVGEAGLKPWLRRVISNLCIDRIRASARTEVTDEVPEQEQPPDQLAAVTGKEVAQRVDAALKGLPERQRQALILFHYEGMSQSEVGAAMGISDEAVESLLSRARRSLRVMLKEDWQALVTDEPGRS